MRDVIRRALWRVNFIDALQLVGQASARLPFGVPDPVLHGSSAVELYTGGLWSAADLDLCALEPCPLIAELFGMGFRWAERPGVVGEACGIRNCTLGSTSVLVERRRIWPSCRMS